MNISTAQSQYYNRPPDERFPSIDALLTAARDDKAQSVERTYNTRDLSAVADAGNVKLASPKGAATLTHWSFGQLARFVGAPAGYLRELPADLAAQCINHGFSELPTGSTAQLLAKPTDSGPLVRAMTSEKYGRLYDAEWLTPVVETLTRNDARWTLPPTWDGKPAGAYRSDRDSFLILVNGGSIVNDPSAQNGNGQMYRGLMIRNSEVGAAAVSIEQILFRFICGNHMLWGAMVDRSFRRRHVGTTVKRDTVREISDIAYRWANQSPARDEAIIRTLIANDIAHSRSALIDELQNFGATKDQATDAVKSAEVYEPANPRSFWGIANGFTRTSQDSGYQDSRYDLDKIAAKIMARGMKQYAVAA